MYTCPFPIHRERGKEEVDVVLLTAISFGLVEREHISVLKKEEGGPGLWKPSPPKKGRR